MIDVCMSCMHGRKPCSTSSLLKSMALTLRRSELHSHTIFVPSDVFCCREEIGVLTSLPLMRKIVADLEAIRNTGGSGLTVYFTKVSTSTEILQP